MKIRCDTIRPYIEKHKKIADLGIGKGYYYTGAKYTDVTGIDIKKENIDKLFKNNPNIKVFMRDIRDCGLPSKAYDLVIVSQVIEHFEDYSPIIKEAIRICKNNGYFLIGVPEKCYHKLHFHPEWNEEKVRLLADEFGTIVDLIKLEDSWLIYVKNGQ